jgi:hypothetical protein
MGLFGKLTAAVIETALLPVEIVKDVVTCGGALTDKKRPYTVDRLKNIKEDLEDVLEDLKD